MNSKRIWKTLFVGAALATGIGLSIKPWQVYAEQREIANQRIEEMRSAEANRTQLLEKKVRLSNATGREQIARSYGYVGPGEQPLETE